MQVIEYIIPYSRPDKFTLFTLGDAHDGTLHFSKESLLKVIKQIKDDPNARWVDMGDKCEFIAPSDPRWDCGSISDWVHPDNVALDEANDYMSLVSPIRDKCLGMLFGNHEDALRRHYHIDIHDYICKQLNVPDLGYSAFVRMKFRRGKDGNGHEVLGFFTHGSGGAITRGAKINRLERIMDNFSADLYAHGHCHDIITSTKAYLALNQDNKIVQRVKVGAMTGCFFKTYSQDVRASYGEIKNYPPTSMGCPQFTIIPDKSVLSVEG